jgi:hypothetical protein
MFPVSLVENLQALLQFARLRLCAVGPGWGRGCNLTENKCNPYCQMYRLRQQLEPHCGTADLM